MPTPNIYAFADEASPLIDGQIAALKRNGLQGLEIRNVDGENVSDISLAKAAEVRKKLDDAGLITWSIGSPIGKIEIEKDDFAAHMDKLRHTVEVAHALGAAHIRMFSFFLPDGRNPADFRNEVLDRLHQMAEACEGSGVKLCHENEKGIYGDNAARCLDVLTEVPQLTGVFDPANFVQVGQDTAEAWAMLKKHIHYMHIKDALPNGSVVPAGYGAGHVKDIVTDYLQNGGTALTIEPHLMTFAGLAALERAGHKSEMGGKFVYQTTDESFDAACAALRGILG